MKKEHWLYVVIAILAIWIIASYAMKPKTTSDTISGENASSTSMYDEDNGADESAAAANAVTGDNGVSVNGNSSSLTDTSVAGQERGTAVAPGQAGSAAGPNKGVYVSSAVPSTGSVSVADQASSSMVMLGVVDMPVSGWVAVHAVDAKGNVGPTIGAQRFDAGSYKGGQVELLHSLTAGMKYVVMIHADNGDKVYDHTADMPYMNGSEVVQTSFTAQ